MEKLASRKLWVAIVTILGVIFGQDFMADTNGDLIAGGIAAAYLIGQGIADAVGKKAVEVVTPPTEE